MINGDIQRSSRFVIRPVRGRPSARCLSARCGLRSGDQCLMRGPWGPRGSRAFKH
jgi:hypothetical protein